MRFNFRLYLQLTFRAFFKAKGTDARLTPKRRKALFWWYLLIPLYHVITWFSFLLDEIFFSGYRRQEVEAPVFIIGNFRSGSTLLQRLIAQDQREMTAMQTWEIYLAPSITQRKLFRFASRYDNKLFDGWFKKQLMKQDDASLGEIPMHRVGLWEVDEDEGILIHNNTSTFSMFVFPFLDAFRPYLYFDTEMPEDERKMSMEFYYRMVQKHMYLNKGKRYIAKNPAFSVKIDSLREYFPDAKFIYLIRNPVDMLASKTSFFSFIWHYFGNPLEEYPFREELLELTRHWYTYSLDRLETLPESEYLVLRYDHLVGNLQASIRTIYDHFGISFSEEYSLVVNEAVEKAANYVSKHKYSLTEIGYTPDQVYQNYKQIFERYEFDLNGKALMARVTEKYEQID
jgi:hypothetical protein